MNDKDLRELFETADGEHPAVTVIAADYRYDGWLVMLGYKRRSRALRCVVEDDCGRLFIHNSLQIRTRDE